MATLNIDLSGRNGLATRGGEDIYKNTTEPHLRYLAGEGQMVEGVYNAFRKYGYMSPVTDSTLDVTAATGAFSNEMGPHAYDPGSNDLFFADDNTIWKADGLDDTTLEEFLNPTTFTYDFFIIDFAYSNSGNNLYIVAQIDYDSPGRDNEEFIFQFDLSTAYDPSTATYSDKKTNITSLSLSTSTFNSFQVNYTGEHVYFGSFNDNTLYHYTISDYDISTMSNTGETLTSSDFPGLDTVYMFHVQDVDPSGSSRKVFAIGDETGSTNTAVESLELDDSFKTWSLASVSTDTTYTLNTTSDAYVQLKFQYGTNDGSRFFVVNQTDNLIEAYNLSTDWNISTASAGDTLAFPFGTGGFFGLNFSEDGTELVFSQEDDADDSFTPYTLSTGYDLSTATAGTGYDFLNISIPEIYDIALYEINSQKALYYSYRVDGDRDLLKNQIGLYNLETGESLVNWMSNYSSTNIQRFDEPAFFQKSSNGFLYAFTDTQVYRIDGSDFAGENGSLTDVLRFDGGFYIDDAEDYREFIYIPIHQGKDITIAPNYSNDVGVYVWNRSSTQANMRDFIRIQGAKRVTAIWTGYDGTLLCTTISANDKCHLRQLKGSEFKVVAEIKREGYPQGRNQVTRGQNASWWIGQNGNVYAYGRVDPADKSNLYDFGQLVTESNVTYGTFFYGGESAGSVSGDNWSEVESFYLTYEGASPTAKIWAPHANADGNFSEQFTVTGDVYTPVTFLPQMSTVRNIEIYCAPTNSSAATQVGTIKFYFNQNDTPYMSKTVTLADLSRGYLDYSIDKQYVNSIQIEIEWEENISLSDDNLFPAQAIVTYEQTSTKG